MKQEFIEVWLSSGCRKIWKISNIDYVTMYYGELTATIFVYENGVCIPYSINKREYDNIVQTIVCNK